MATVQPRCLCEQVSPLSALLVPMPLLGVMQSARIRSPASVLAFSLVRKEENV